jgi:N-hydroxyarylamine O-acetyltransferase
MGSVGAFDVDAYFRRIGYAGSAAATLETLAGIHRRHACSIPFENLSPFLRWPVRLDATSLFQKMVRDGRGGYCFEQNLLFSHCLTTLGFHVTWLAARVMWNNPEGVLGARSHMLLLIDVDGRPHVADVGFGGLTLTGPLRLEPYLEQPTPHETFRLVSSGSGFIMQAQLGSLWKSLYVFDLHPQTLPDYDVSNWYLSNHPGSYFVTTLVAARPDSDRRYALRNNELAIHRLDGTSARRVLLDVRDLRDAFTDLFRVNVPEGAEVDEAFRRVASLPAQLPV